MRPRGCRHRAVGAVALRVFQSRCRTHNPSSSLGGQPFSVTASIREFVPEMVGSSALPPQIRNRKPPTEAWNFTVEAEVCKRSHPL